MPIADHCRAAADIVFPTIEGAQHRAVAIPPADLAAAQAHVDAATALLREHQRRLKITPGTSASDDLIAHVKATMPPQDVPRLVAALEKLDLALILPPGRP